MRDANTVQADCCARQGRRTPPPPSENKLKLFFCPFLVFFFAKEYDLCGNKQCFASIVSSTLQNVLCRCQQKKQKKPEHNIS